MIKTYENFINKISYSGIILKDYDRNKLLNRFDIPDGWIKYAHHMTICLGELPKIYKEYINNEIELTVTHYGENKNVIAVKVNGFFTLNRKGDETNERQEHITIATNSNSSPKYSNYIKNWIEIKPFNIKGVVKEII